MNLALQALLQNGASKLATAELALFKAGQVLQALVVGQTGSGLTQLKIGDVLIEAQLPQPAQPGTMLQLQVKTGGSAPQLALLSQQAPAATVEVARMPPPVQLANVALPEVEAPAVPALSAQPRAPQVVVQPQAQPTAPVQGQPPQVVTTTPVAAPQVAPPLPAQPVIVQPAMMQPQIVPAQPQIVPQGQGVTPQASQIESAMPAALAPQQASVQPAPQAPAQPQPLPQLTVPSPQIVAPVVVRPPPAIVQLPIAPPVVSAPLGPQPQPQPQPQPVPQPLPQAQVVMAAVQQPAVPTSVEPPPAQPVVPQPAAQTAPAPEAPEPVAANPLLLAQAAAKVLQTLADLPKMASAPVQLTPAAPQPLPATPEQAVAQMAPEAMAKQNSVAPLLQSLAAVIARPALLPEPIVRAALQVLAQRIVTPDGKVQAADIEKAVARSGVFLEAALASAAPVRGDAKAALLGLRAVLEKFLGGAPPANPPAQREAPPLRELPPRAMAMEAPPLPDAPRDVARALHGQTDAAISRVKLGQLAGLPDAPNTPRPAQPELRMELPFLIGHELVMAQLQIAQDGRREPATRKRGWTMRFAMNFSQTGEVGAEVGLLGKAVNVALWAAEPATAEAMNAALPELARALEGLGLDPGAVRIRRAVPEAPRIASGHFVDAVT